MPRIGASSTSGTDREALRVAARLAREAAAHAPKTEFAGFAKGGAPSDTSAIDEGTVAYSPLARAEALARLFARAARDRLQCAGAFRTGARELAVATSGGVRRRHRVTEGTISLIALDGDASGHAAWHGPRAPNAAELERLGEEACERGARSRDPIDLAPGPIDVVLSPHAVAEVLEWMAIGSFDARGVLDGTSALAGRQGEQIVDPRLTIAEDPTYPHPNAVPYLFDAEGTPKRRVVMIDAGKAGEPLSDLAAAARLKKESTGNANPLDNQITDAPMPTNLVLVPGEPGRDLVAGVERGLLVTRFHYVNGFLDTRRATMTGMTRDGAFLIEQGKLGRAVKNLRWTESMLDAFSAERLGGIGGELQAVPTSWTPLGAYLCPSLLVRGWHFTGKSR